MAEPVAHQDISFDRLLKEYSRTFVAMDDLTVARWCAQTLGQFFGSVWRASHPLMSAYRLAAQVAHDRRLWSQRLVNIPHGYHPSPCCGAPFLPILTRNVGEQGLICQHCHEPLVPLEELPVDLGKDVRAWAAAYEKVHEVAHWEEELQTKPNYDAKFEEAAQKAEDLLVEAATLLAPRLLDLYPVIVWDDQDECLEVRPEDIEI